MSMYTPCTAVWVMPIQEQVVRPYIAPALEGLNANPKDGTFVDRTWIWVFNFERCNSGAYAI
jgi:hypothetical protein